MTAPDTRAESRATAANGAPSAPATPAGLAAPNPARARIAPLLDAIDRQLHLGEGEFIGRDFVRAVIGEFLASRNRMLVLVGLPGVGKTALAAQLVREQIDEAHPYLAHFCSLPDGENPVRFCESLAEQLVAYLGADYRLPSSIGKQVQIDVDVSVGQAGDGTRITGLEIKELKIGSVHPREAFRMLVREPLREYDLKYGGPPGGAPLRIVIDGLDRAWQWDGGQSANIVGVLADVQDLPPWVNLICTARPGQAVPALRAQAGVWVYDIEATGEQNLADIRAFLVERFIGRLDPAALERFEAALAQQGAPASPAAGPQEARAAFIEQAVAASEGNFGFVKHYVEAWQLALHPAAGHPTIETAALLSFERGVSLGSTLEATYAAIDQQVRQEIAANPLDADELVLATLAIAFEPVNLPLLATLAGWRGSQEALADALRRLAAVIEESGDGPSKTYALYHRGFADYVRRNLPLGGRDRDLAAAQALEQGDESDPLLRGYRARHRWAHLLRGLDINMAEATHAPAPAPAAEGAALDWRDGVARVQRLAPDAVTRAQLLRLMAARALNPSEAEAEGSWTGALSALKTAEQELRRSRAIRQLGRRGWRLDAAQAPPELYELEQTLIALGDAYRTIGQRCDIGGRQFDDWVSKASWPFKIWDMIIRLPLTIYLVLVLALQGVREIRLPGALQNLGRGQDWTIARLYVLSMSAYRRARALTRARSEAADDDVLDRLGRTYMLMGAYDAAAATYEMLLSRPAAVTSPWRQAVWLHALGEVLLAQRRADRAVEALTKALLTFKSQEAPVLQAWGLSALAAAHAMQANAAEERGDHEIASALDDTTIGECGEAIVAWRNVTALRGGEAENVDPALALSRVGHQLWQIERGRRSSEEQARRARQLRASIQERHYPQHFEHPVVRLFRVAATALLPGVILLGLLLAVQTPSSFLVNTQIELVLQPPLLDLNRFSADLISSGTALPAPLDSEDLTRLVAGSGWRQFAPAAPHLSAPALDLLSITAVALLVIGLYLLVYLLCGVVMIALSSPAHFQRRQPGRLIVRPEGLEWRGQPSLAVWGDTWRWLRLAAGNLAAALRHRLSAALGLPPGQASAPPDAPPARLAWSQIERAVTLNRLALGRLLGDFSFTLVEGGRQTGGGTAIFIPGTLAFYDELSEELGRRLGRRRRSFRVEILSSASGIFFLLTLAYSLALMGLSGLAPEATQVALPPLDYSLSDMYVIVAPGLVLPLLWWFVAQPLAARTIQGRARIPLGCATLAAAALTAAVLLGGESLNLLGFQPDLFTPVLAAGVLAALVASALPRPLYRAFALNWQLLRTALAIAAAAALLPLAWRIGETVAWYDSLVRGNIAIERGLRNPACASGEPCAPFATAIKHYTSQICLRPGSPEGYAFRGFTSIAQRQYLAAREDFAEALRVAKRVFPTPPEGCLAPLPSFVSTEREAALFANLGAANMLLAREQEDQDEAEAFHQEALTNYLWALSVLDGGPDSPAARLLASGQSKGCYDLAGELLALTPDQMLGLSTPMSAAGAREAPYLLQLADACYSRGFSRARALDESLLDRERLRREAWEDLTASVALYSAAREGSGDASERRLAERGRAAAWLILGQFDPLPPGAPDRRSYLLRALASYTALADEPGADEGIYAGKAWSIILLGAWNDASEPLARAAELNPQSPTYPALQGLVRWLDSTKYRPPPNADPLPEHTRALSDALGLYTRVIALERDNLSEAYATRSVLYYSLRNSPRGPDYDPAAFETWMRRAIGDMDEAILLEERSGAGQAAQVGFRYWRGRLSFTLALDSQQKRHGVRSWDEIATLYSRALADFSAAAAADVNTRRKSEYDEIWIPWARHMHSNAVHLQLAQRAAQEGDYALARSELELVRPTLTPQQRRDWGALAAPRPEYSLLHGLISLGLDQPEDFPNPLVEGAQGAEASYQAALADLASDEIVPPDARAALYQAALSDLEALLADEGAELSPATRAAAERVRQQLEALVGEEP